MSEEKEKKENKAFLTAAQFLFGAAMIGFSVYGWKCLEIEGFLMFILGATGFGFCASSLGLKWDHWF